MKFLILAVLLISILVAGFAYQWHPVRQSLTTNITANPESWFGYESFEAYIWGSINVRVTYSGGHNILVGIVDIATGNYTSGDVEAITPSFIRLQNDCSANSSIMDVCGIVLSKNSGTLSVLFDVCPPASSIGDWKLRAVASLADDNFNPIAASASQITFMVPVGGIGANSFMSCPGNYRVYQNGQWMELYQPRPPQSEDYRLLQIALGSSLNQYVPLLLITLAAGASSLVMVAVALHRKNRNK